MHALANGVNTLKGIGECVRELQTLVNVSDILHSSKHKPVRFVHGES
jgi:hypothetical protein